MSRATSTSRATTPSRAATPRRNAPTARARGEAGQVGGIEVLPFGLLIFVIGALIATNAWGVVDAKVAAGAAARQAARAYVEAPDARSALDQALAAARQSIEGHGRNPDRVELDVAHEDDQPWRRCVRVTITVRYPVATISLPLVGGYGDGFEVRSSHSEIIDPYRSGLPAEGRC